MDTLTPSDQEKFQEAWAAHKDGKLLRARKIYQGLVRKYPNFPPLLNALGTLLLDLGKTEEAERTFEKASRGAPHVPALYNLARLKHVKGLINEAGRLYENIIRVQADFGPAWNNLGLLLRECGRLQEALKAVTEAVRLMPGHPEPLNNLGVIQEALAMFSEAEASFLNAVSLDAEYFSAHYNLACLYHKLEQFQEAERELRWILKRRPKDPGATYLLQAMGSLPAPDRAPAQYVAKTFDDCAAVFEKKLRALEYTTPERLFALVRPLLRKGMNIMDLGCGTGLGAEYYKDFASMLWGMDCSQKMIGIAAQKGLYDRLLKQDILEPWNTGPVFDLVYSSDCMVYFGNLQPVFTRVAEHMRNGAFFAFTVERPEGRHPHQDGFQLRNSGRFAHEENYVERCLERAGFKLLEKKGCTLRKEAEKPVEGLLFTARLRPIQEN